MKDSHQLSAISHRPCDAAERAGGGVEDQFLWGLA